MKRENVIRFENLRVKHYTRKTYVAEVINKGKRKYPIVCGVFTIKEARQWKHLILAFEEQVKEL